MDMKPYYLGIDLGTSSVKGILRSADGETRKAKCTYAQNTPNEWFSALRTLISDLKSRTNGRIAAVGLSSQVGTYVVNGTEVISWQSDAGRSELEEIKSAIGEDEFIRFISMPHPDLISYPLPRLLYIEKHFGTDAEVLMPKELLIRELTGNTVTDLFSMRGIAHLKNGTYAEDLLQKLGIHLRLPHIKHPTDLAGYITEEVALRYGLEPGTPVYLGCNDFFAGLIGMGISHVGDAFDLSGTSEHVGYLSEELNREGFVSGAYFVGNCTYGGTKSSGASCDLAIRQFGIDHIDLEAVLTKNPPLFLPYLSGERAPIFDENARGVYFGLSADTDSASLAYATLEGVVFSLYDIASAMHAPTPRRLVCGGGSSRNELMNLLRATLFECDVVRVQESDTSALGACMLAMVGAGVYSDLSTAIRACVAYDPPVKPDPRYRDILLSRFAVYRELYPALKKPFSDFKALESPLKP